MPILRTASRSGRFWAALDREEDDVGQASEEAHRSHRMAAREAVPVGQHQRTVGTRAVVVELQERVQDRAAGHRGHEGIEPSMGLHLEQPRDHRERERHQGGQRAEHGDRLHDHGQPRRHDAPGQKLRARIGEANVPGREDLVLDVFEGDGRRHGQEQADHEVQAEVALGREPAPVEAGPRGGGGAHGVGHGGRSAISATFASKAPTQPSRSRLASGPRR